MSKWSIAMLIFIAVTIAEPAIWVVFQAPERDEARIKCKRFASTGPAADEASYKACVQRYRAQNSFWWTPWGLRTAALLIILLYLKHRIDKRNRERLIDEYRAEIRRKNQHERSSYGDE